MTASSAGWCVQSYCHNLRFVSIVLWDFHEVECEIPIWERRNWAGSSVVTYMSKL